MKVEDPGEDAMVEYTRCPNAILKNILQEVMGTFQFSLHAPFIGIWLKFLPAQYHLFEEGIEFFFFCRFS